MNPILQEALGSVIRWALAIGAGYLVKAGIWNCQDATTYVSAAAVALMTLGWSLWQKYQSRRKLLTALTMTVGATENDVATKVASGVPVPTVTTPKDTVPGVPSAPR